MTDTNNLFGALEFAQKAAKDGVQPIIGCQIDVSFSDEPDRSGRGAQRGPQFRPLVLIAATEAGYANLVSLVSRAYLDLPAGEPTRVTPEWMADLSEGIICLTGGPRGPIGGVIAADPAMAERRLTELSRIYGDRLYVELERMGRYDRVVENATVDLAYRLGLPLVATNEAFFLKASDYEAHDALLAIAEGSVMAVDDRRRLTPDHHLKTQDEMAALFADLPEAIDNTIEIAAAAPTIQRTASRSCRALPKRTRPTPRVRSGPRPTSFAARRGRDWNSGSPATDCRRATRATTTRSGWNSSSASSSA